MNSVLLPYLETKKERTKRKVSDLLTKQGTKRVAKDAFDFHFKDKRSLAFQIYYGETVSNRDAFLSKPFFRTFKQMYALQGIDGDYLDRLEEEKERLLCLVDETNLPQLYDEFFADVSLQHKQGFRSKTLGSFFAKFVHTFLPDEYCALDNPIKTYFGLGKESFYVALVVISHAYKEWARENPDLMQHIRAELEKTKTGRSFSSKMTDLKLLDLIMWHQANKA